MKVSPAPRAYASALSKKLTPFSKALATMSVISFLSCTEPPYVVHAPRLTVLTFMPARPSLR